jgi:hypothetical protein
MVQAGLICRVLSGLAKMQSAGHGGLDTVSNTHPMSSERIEYADISRAHTATQLVIGDVQFRPPARRFSRLKPSTKANGRRRRWPASLTGQRRCPMSGP